MTSQGRILIVDDDKDWTEALSDLLQYWGHEVCVVNAGQETLDRALAFRPSLVILDVELPGMNGREVARALRAAPELADSRLVALSGHGPPRDPDQTETLDFDRYWTKPLDPDTLEQLLLEL